jgi:hypothetical protein
MDSAMPVQKGQLMDKQEIDKKVREEMLHISFNTANPWQRMLRALYNMLRRQDLTENPSAEPRESLMRCAAELSQSDPDFHPFDLDFDTTYFGGMPPEWLDSGMKNRKERILMILERDKVLRMWKTFAGQNNLELAWFTDLVLRAGCVVQQDGGCPCLPEERSACPCEEVLNECHEQGQCHCRVFLSHDFKDRILAKA